MREQVGDLMGDVPPVSVSNGPNSAKAANAPAAKRASATAGPDSSRIMRVARYPPTNSRIMTLDPTVARHTPSVTATARNIQIASATMARSERLG